MASFSYKSFFKIFNKYYADNAFFLMQVSGTFRGYSDFSEREREEMAVPEGMTASV